MSGKNRLGRGLGGLISGGLGAAAPADAKAPATKAGAMPEKAVPVAPTPPPAPIPAQEPVLAKVAVSGTVFQEVPISKVEPNPFQPRKEFEPEALHDLAESIRSEGLINPILVRKKGDRFELIAGERRLRACQSLSLRTVLAHVVEASDASSAIISLIENLHRKDLNPIEEARSFASAMQNFHLTQDALAERVGKARATIANALRLLELDSETQGYLAKGQISVGHAKVLLGLDDRAQRQILARRVIEENLSVRAVEDLVRKAKLEAPAKPGAAPRKAAAAQETVIRDLERQISAHLNTRVALKHSPKRGRIVIEYFGNEDLQRILERLGVEK